MRLEIVDAQRILWRFSIQETTLSFVPIQETFREDGIRLIYELTTVQGGHWVCRLSSERNYPKSLVERQSLFSELLRMHGVLIPHKIKSDEGYCSSMAFGPYLFQVTVEEWIGRNLDEVTEETFLSLGKLLGRCHILSERHPMKLGYSTISKSIKNGQACFRKILCSVPHWISYQEVADAARLHDALVLHLASIQETLPTGAVHGDLGIFNNLLQTEKGIAMIDFNMAGDEVFLWDMLITYYASIHKYSWRKRLARLNLMTCYSSFFSGYQGVRTLTEVERSTFPEAAALFDGLFYCKAIVEEYWDCRDLSFLKKFREAREHFTVKHMKLPIESKATE